ncbi:hypothetical protein ACOGYR_003385, partial [Edwardsiella piscicida]
QTKRPHAKAWGLFVYRRVAGKRMTLEENRGAGGASERREKAARDSLKGADGQDPHRQRPWNRTERRGSDV